MSDELFLFSPRLLRWENNLKGLSAGRKAIIRQSLHIMSLGVLTSIVLFRAVKISALQPVFMGIRTRESWWMIIFFLFGFALFCIPWAGSIS